MSVVNNWHKRQRCRGLYALAGSATLRALRGCTGGPVRVASEEVLCGGWRIGRRGWPAADCREPAPSHHGGARAGRKLEFFCAGAVVQAKVRRATRRGASPTAAKTDGPAAPGRGRPSRAAAPPRRRGCARDAPAAPSPPPLGGRRPSPVASSRSLARPPPAGPQTPPPSAAAPPRRRASAPRRRPPRGRV